MIMKKTLIKNRRSCTTGAESRKPSRKTSGESVGYVTKQDTSLKAVLCGSAENVGNRDTMRETANTRATEKGLEDYDYMD